MLIRRLSVLLAGLVVAGSALFGSAAPSGSAPAPADTKPATTRPRVVETGPADKASPRGGAANPDAGWMKRHDAYVKLAEKGGIDVYFLGDSITDGWHGKGKAVWQKEFAPLKAENFGIGGDRTQHLLYRLENGEFPEALKPKVVVLMIGTNNLGANKNADIVAGNKAIIDHIAKKSPATKILLLGIFPRWGNKETKALQPRVAEINAELAKLDNGKTVKFLDIGEKFLVEGKLTAEIMPDGLHPNEKGYEIWADAIRQPLNDLLK